MHANISSSFGSAVTSVRGYTLSIILTTLLSWPVAILIAMIPHTAARILLPFVVFFMSFIIMSCPQLTSPNMMILVMYIAIATNVRENISQWETWGWAITYIIGLAIALLVNLFPFFRSSLFLLRKQISRLEKDFTVLLIQCRTYADITASAPGISRVSSATIDMMSDRIIKSVKEIRENVDPAIVELSWQCEAYSAKSLKEWVTQLENLLAPVKVLQNSLTQHVLGEDLGLSSHVLSRVKMIIKEEIMSSRNRLIDAMIAAIAVCDACADHSLHRRVLPGIEEELQIVLEECNDNLNIAISRSAKLLDEDSSSNVSILAHLIRRTTALNAIFEFAESLLYYLKHHRWDQLCCVEKNQNTRQSRTSLSLSSFKAFVQLQWFWYDHDRLRLALKTSVGMAIASLFVSIDYLWIVSEPFGIWPGLTIASVNLGKTGSSFHKAQDRLFGTMLAGAYALLVTDLFPGNKDAVKIPAIALFTYVIIYTRNAKHAYKFTYAATSIGSMLYGSVKNDFNIAGYIPKRIELIFVGTVIFGFVELMMFPGSSRNIVEHVGYELFFSVRDFMHQTTKCVQHMELFIENSNRNDEPVDCFKGDDLFQLNDLVKLQKKLRAQCSKIKVELESGINEPNMGLSLKMNAPAFRDLVKAFDDCETQTFLLLKALQKLAKGIEEGEHPMRQIKWAPELRIFTDDTLSKLNYSCDWLESAFPDARLRPQQGNAVKAVVAAASFRDLDGIRLKAISKCSVMYSKYIHDTGLYSSDPVSLLTIGITLTYILDICRHLQEAGKNLEKISYEFPASSKQLLSKDRIKLSGTDNSAV